LSGDSKITLAAALDSSEVRRHPSLLVLQQQKNSSVLNTQLEKSRLLPNLSLGYSNMSIQGMGSDNVLYPKSSRFSSVQFGVGVPLFFGSQKALINSSKTLELIADNNYKYGLQTIGTDYQKALKNFKAQTQTVDYFETVALKNAETIIKTANQQFANGDINYLEWTMLVNNATTIKSEYCDALKQLNYSVIELHYLMNK
jgi:cobalt-zinc-cadmium resistance protein CzcA